MDITRLFRKSKPPNPTVFISYYNADDQTFKDEFEWRFGHLFRIKSSACVKIPNGSISSYATQLKKGGYLPPPSVIVVLVGPKTYCRKHVDWEIYAGLSFPDNAALLGILLPEFPFKPNRTYNPELIPPRLLDNVKSGYAELYMWKYACSSDHQIESIIQEALSNRETKKWKIDNSRPHYSKDLCC